MPVVGLLITHRPVDDGVVDSLPAGPQDFRFEDGKNYRLEVRSALGRLERLPVQIEDLIRLGVDLLLVVNEYAIRAAHRVTRPILIDDPVLAHSVRLLAYGAESIRNWARGAYFIGRPLNGMDAARLPMERFSRLKLTVNFETAKMLAVTIPQTVQLRADEVIQ